MEASKESLHDDGGEDEDARDADRSDTSKIYRIVKDMAQAGAAASAGRRATRRRTRRLGRGPDGERDEAGAGAGEDDEDGGSSALDVLSMVDIRARVLRAGYTETQLMTTIQEVRVLWLLEDRWWRTEFPCVCAVRGSQYLDTRGERFKAELRMTCPSPLGREDGSWLPRCSFSYFLSAFMYLYLYPNYRCRIVVRGIPVFNLHPP